MIYIYIYINALDIDVSMYATPFQSFIMNLNNKTFFMNLSDVTMTFGLEKKF